MFLPPVNPSFTHKAHPRLRDGRNTQLRMEMKKLKKVKDREAKYRPCTHHEGKTGEWRYNSAHSLTLLL